MGKLVEKNSIYKTFVDSMDNKYWKLVDANKRRKPKSKLRKNKQSFFFFYNNCYKALKYLLKEKLKDYEFTLVLNLCGAPGGFCKVLMERKETVHVFTLPEANGGWPMRIEDSPKQAWTKISVNMHGPDYGDIVKLASLAKG